MKQVATGKDRIPGLLAGLYEFPNVEGPSEAEGK